MLNLSVITFLWYTISIIVMSLVEIFQKQSYHYWNTIILSYKISFPHLYALYKWINVLFDHSSIIYDIAHPKRQLLCFINLRCRCVVIRTDLKKKIYLVCLFLIFIFTDLYPYFFLHIKISISRCKRCSRLWNRSQAGT